MAADEPIQFREICKLTNLGINQQFINFNFVSLESDKYCSVKEPGDGNNTFYIVDLSTKKVDTHSMKADAALNHPSAKVVALRAKNKLQVRNLEMNSVTGSTTMSDEVVFWKWISPSMLALVTESAVYHWSLEKSDSSPKKVFERLEDLADSQIINYRVDSSMEWCCLVGLAREGDRMAGHLQLYSRGRNASQHIEGHACAFVDFKIPLTTETANVICIASARADGGKLFLRDLSGSSSFENKSVDIQFQAGDFPVSMQASSHYGLVYVLTRTGTLTLYDVRSGTMIFGKRLSADPIFITTPHDDRGFVGVNRAGQVVSCTVHEGNFVPYILNKLQDRKLAFEFSARADLPGAEELYEMRLNSCLSSGDLENAIRVIQASPGGFLRSQETIENLKRLPQGPDGKPPVLTYFRTLLETTKLNAVESFELASLALQRGPSGVSYLKKLLEDDQIEGSEKLGDLLRPVDKEMALKLYARGNAGGKVIEGLIESGQYDNVFKYCESTNYQADWYAILRNLISHGNYDGAEKMATLLADKNEVDPNKVATLFVQAGMFQQVTSFLIEVLKDDKEEQCELQTRLLEITLSHCPPNITERIFANDMLSHFDKNKIAKLCEQKQLYARALECYTEIEDIKRVMVHAVQMLDPNWLIKFFSSLDVEDCLLCFQELLKRNIRQNLQLVVGASKAYCSQIGTHKLIELFDTFKTPEGMFHFLRGIVPVSEDPEVHFRYIEAAVKVGNMGEVERMTHDSNLYDPERTKEFLKEARLSNMWPLINVCDKHGYIEELVEYLYNNGQLKYVDAYVQQRSPQNAPRVIGALLDVDCNEDHVIGLLMNVGPLCPVDDLCEQVEERNRLKLILPWLEARNAEGSEEPGLHNALAKIYIDMNKDPQRFLEDNPYYDSLVVGKYCERRDPLLAYVAYKRGQCDDELVHITNKTGMYRQQATYLTERKDMELWGKVLVETNKHRQSVIDQVIQSALPESRDPDEVSVTVKAFMVAKLPHQLIELLEKIVMHGSSNFRSNKNLQNLLILTAVNADQSKVMGFVQQLDNYEAGEVASICHKKGLFEEAFYVYKKHDMYKEAIDVLMYNIQDLLRAQEYADRVDQAEVHSMLARCQLENDLVKEALASYMKAEDPNDFNLAIDGVERVQDFYAELIKYLIMCRKKIKDNNIDTEIVYSYARINKLAEMEDFINIPGQLAKVQQVGDRCFAQELYEAAKILFLHVGNHAKLASTLVKLGDYAGAYDAAKKANSIRTWKEVAIACIDAQQYQLAHMAALNIVVSADHMDEIIHHYEARGLFEEVIHLLEVGLSMEKAHREMFTELGVLYAKYKPEKLMEHIRIFSRKVNTSKLIRACETHHHWRELRFLYHLIDEHDNAVRTMIDHSSVAWEHTTDRKSVV